MTPDWIVEEVTRTVEERAYGARAYYRLHVTLRNLADSGRTCYWSVRDLADPRYDLTRIHYIEPGAERYFGRDPQESKP